MPELPEVETIRRGLSSFIIHKKLEKTTILCEKSFIGQPVTGTVVSLRRFGKALVIDLDNGFSLMAHLRMTGQLIYDPLRTATVGGTSGSSGSANPTAPSSSQARFAAGHPSENFLATLPNRQTRVILHFDSGTLFFNDQRKFGFIKPLPTVAIMSDPFVKKLAPEPWAMSPADFCARLSRHPGAPVKAVLLDQTIICGLGNIYADEALFAASIHPERRAASLSREEATRLLAAACTVMDRSIASGGSTMATYVKADGTRGDYLEKFSQVFRRDGKPCPRCGAVIKKIRVAGRGTHLCPQCQKISVPCGSPSGDTA